MDFRQRPSAAANYEFAINNAGYWTARAPYHRDTISGGYDYNLSVRTDVYAVAVYDKLSTAASGATLATGVRHKF